MKLYNVETLTDLTAKHKTGTVPVNTPFTYNFRVSKEIWNLFMIKYNNEKYFLTDNGWAR